MGFQRPAIFCEKRCQVHTLAMPIFALYSLFVDVRICSHRNPYHHRSKVHGGMVVFGIDRWRTMLTLDGFGINFGEEVENPN